MCILTYRSPYRVAEKKGRGRRAGKASSRGAPREMWGWGVWSGHWGSRKLALLLLGHRLGCPVVHICNLNFSTSLLGIPVSASELFISAFISHILHCVDLRWTSTHNHGQISLISSTVSIVIPLIIRWRIAHLLHRR